MKQAGFRVLVGAYMPAILVEVGFLSNPTEETLLLSRDYQQRLARAIGDAILTYRDAPSPPDDADAGGPAMTARRRQADGPASRRAPAGRAAGAGS